MVKATLSKFSLLRRCRENYILEIIRKHREEFRQRQGLQQGTESEKIAEQFTPENAPENEAKSFDIGQHNMKAAIAADTTTQAAPLVNR